MDPFQVTRKGIHVTGTYAASPTDLYKAMLDLRDVEIPFDRIFTHKFPMVEATEGILSVDRLEPVIGLIDHSR
jgi:threonine dehydrogenase-like Zn-dependent dehydrogenase